MTSTSNLNTPTNGVNTRSASPRISSSRGATPSIPALTDQLVTPNGLSPQESGKEPSLEAALEILRYLSGLASNKLGTKAVADKIKEITALVTKAMSHFSRNQEEVLTKADLQNAMAELKASLTGTSHPQTSSQSYASKTKEGISQPMPHLRPALSDNAQAKQVLVSLKHANKNSPFLSRPVAELADMFNVIIAKWVTTKPSLKMSQPDPVRGAARSTNGLVTLVIATGPDAQFI
ncbi:hypothetical protein FRB94_004425 [Tulasnella sp. JGI-2019a]|nr:hypothetical protein FRB93_003616 [Tulasnella sp. JGI-2019a]KAG9001893.1 hypothetical protein FRB94_004425 [Tulasnella sp. JGI-2019a]KAG9029356.1 hypothetical protein FRB95_005472 [Tulasnella sp. JGI-2019a]